MDERTKLLRKAVLTSVGASTNADRIKKALDCAMEDLIKVGQELIDDLESKGKVKAESMQKFLKNLQEEAGKRTCDIEKTVSKKVSSSVKQVARDWGLGTKEDFEELFSRLSVIEEALGIENQGNGKKRVRKKSQD